MRISIVQCLLCDDPFFLPGGKTSGKSASDLLSEHALKKKNSLSMTKSDKTSGLLQPQHNSGPNGVSKKTAPVLASESEFELFAPDVIVRPAKVDSGAEDTNAIPLDSKLHIPKVSPPVVNGNGEEKAGTVCPTVNRARNGCDAEVMVRDNQNTTLRGITSRLGQVASSLGPVQASPSACPASQAPSLAKVEKK